MGRRNSTANQEKISSERLQDLFRVSPAPYGCGMSDQTLQLAFAGLHPDRVRELVASHGVPGTLRRIRGGGLKVSDRARAAVDVPAASRTEELEASGVRFVPADTAGYPAGLAELPDAPPGLFVRGALEHDRPMVAVVGTRRCTTYGKHLAFEYGAAIVEAGWGVVSGLARGIDGAAHRGVASTRGVGVAVLGSGLDVMYPAEHADLAARLVDYGGGVVSEYPPGTPPQGWRFPPRNRIISGMSQAVVVVEAAAKGGALITANYALAHGRPVFAVPGDVRRASSEGCNLLIRDGAHPVLDPADLIEELSLVLGPPRPEVPPDLAQPVIGAEGR
jgi:DNA processing protein